MSLSEQEVLDFIRNASYETLLKSKDENNIPYLKHIFDLHFKIFGQTCSNCPSKITGYIQKLKNYNAEMSAKNLKIMSEAKQEFKLKEGVIVPVPGTSIAYSSSNITDEIAVELLSKNINRKDMFEVLPEDWKERVENFTEIEEVEEVELPNIDGIDVVEVIKLLEAVGVTTKATTVEGLNKKIAGLDPETLEAFQKELTDYLIASKKAE